MGLLSPGGENLLDFLELRQVLSTYDGDLSVPIWWPQERPVPMRVARVLLGIPLPSMLGREIEENNRMGKTRDLFKKIRDTKGTFHAKMGTINDRSGMDLTEAEDIKKR